MEKFCDRPGCSRRFRPKNGQQRYCCPECRMRDKARVERLVYGPGHKRLRAAWAPQVATGAVLCARCHKSISNGEAWDLGHPDDRPGEPSSGGPEHVSCNRRTMRPPGVARVCDPADFVDDSERGVYWGPPAEPGDDPVRWSRPWFSWRSRPEFARYFVKPESESAATRKDGPLGPCSGG